MTARTPEEVFEDHLRLAEAMSVEDDLDRNYAEDVIILYSGGVYRGHDGARELADRLTEELPDAVFHYKTKLVEGEFAFLEWSAEARGVVVNDGADSFCIRDGLVVCRPFTTPWSPPRPDPHSLPNLHQ
jgi:hypothetical protein